MFAPLLVLLLPLRLAGPSAATPAVTAMPSSVTPPTSDSAGTRVPVASDSVSAVAAATETAERRDAAGPRLAPSRFADTSRAPTADRQPPTAALPPADTIRPHRPRAVEYSDWYARRLAIHRVGSYAMLPLFVGEYALGQRLLSTSPQPNWVRPTHRGVAYGLGALFAVNTVTGAWNLWDSRSDENGRTRRLVHTALMLASDAGFAYTGSIGQQGRSSLDASYRHRNAALVSMGISVVGSGMMYFWKD